MRKERERGRDGVEELHHPTVADETEVELGGPPMVDSNPAASVAGEGHQRDRSDKEELAVVEARRDVAAAQKEKPAKLAAK